MKPENLDEWTLPPSVDLALVDSAFAARMKDECSTGDIEGNGCRADEILDELLRKLGMTATADAYKALYVWRA